MSASPAGRQQPAPPASRWRCRCWPRVPRKRRQANRFAECGQKTFRDGDRAKLIREIAEEHAEFIATEPRGEIRRRAASTAGARRQRSKRDRRPHAEAVIDRLEVVEIEEQRSHRARCGTSAKAISVASMKRRRLVRPGQRIMEGLEAELRLERAPLGDVTGQGPDQAGEAGQDQQRQQRRSRPR